MIHFPQTPAIRNRTKVQWVAWDVVSISKSNASTDSVTELRSNQMPAAAGKNESRPTSVAAHPDLFHWLANDIQQTKLKSMPFEKFDLENLDKERRKAIAKSVRTISTEELKKPWGRTVPLRR